MLRHTRRIIIFLLLGAIVNIAVAWGCALRSEFTTEEAYATTLEFPERDKRGWVGVERGLGIGIVRQELRTSFRDVRPGEENCEEISFSSHLPDLCWEGPVQHISWSRLGVDERAVLECETAAGWPMLSLWCADLEYFPDQKTYASHPTGRWSPARVGLNIGGLFAPSDRVPLIPICRGFVTNTLFYAALLWLPFFNAHVIRRRLRARKHHCPHCNYPFGESPTCTECGRDLSRWAEQHT